MDNDVIDKNVKDPGTHLDGLLEAFDAHLLERREDPMNVVVLDRTYLENVIVTKNIVQSKVQVIQKCNNL